MALPLALRNALAELVLDAFDHDEARQALAALVALCRDPEAPVAPPVTPRLTGLGWFQATTRGGLRLAEAHRAHLEALCRRAAAALAVFAGDASVPTGDTLPGLLARAARLADQGLFFETHELLEPTWMRAEGTERVALQALIQIAVALQHAANGNLAGARSLLAEGLAKLPAVRTALPLDTAAWEPALRAMLAALGEDRLPVSCPPWPAPTHGGSAVAPPHRKETACS